MTQGSVTGKQPKASPFDLFRGLLPWSMPADLPPFLGPAIAVLAGSTVAWRWPDWRLLPVFALIFGVFNTWIVRWQSRRTVVILCACFLLASAHQTLLVLNGRSVQQSLAGVIHEVDAQVWRASEGSNDGWGHCIIRLADGSLVQLTGSVAHLLPGQSVRLLGRFSMPSPQRNPGGLDEARMLAQKGVFLKADLLLNRVEITDPSVSSIQLSVIRIRKRVADAARFILPAQQAALLLGILIGDTSHLSTAEKDSFRAAGLSHLMAVSGANVTFILIPVLFLLRRTVGRRRFRSALMLVFLIAFGFLTGWEASVTRAILMMALMLAGQVIYRRSDPLNALLFAATVMLAVKPLLIISLSFHLSFLATLGILLFSTPLDEWLEHHVSLIPRPIRQLICINLAVQLAVLPLQTLISGQLSPFTMIANLPAMPLAEGATIGGSLGILLALPVIVLVGNPLSLTVIANVLQVLNWPARFLLQSLSKLALLFSEAFWPRLLTGSLPPLVIAAYVCFVLAFLMSGKRCKQMKRLAAILLLAAVLLQISTVWSRPELEIILLDVGQGDCTVIRSRDGQVILIDAGTESAGRQAVKPALQALGIASVDLAILTHGHSDHAGGLLSLMAEGVIQELCVPWQAQQVAAGQADNSKQGFETDLMVQVLKLANDCDIPVQLLRKGDTIPISRSSFLQVLAPDYPQRETELAVIARTRGANAFNLVLRLNAPDWTMLLAGDCDLETEQALLGNPLIDTDALRVAHHGSAVTTGNRLIEAVTPKLALISVGKNDYGHPSPAVLDRLAVYRIPVFRTDRLGAITLHVKNGQCSVRSMIKP